MSKDVVMARERRRGGWGGKGGNKCAGAKLRLIVVSRDREPTCR